MDLVLATRNRDKIKELKALLSSLPLKIMAVEEFPDTVEVAEDGKDCRENAIKKAVEVSRETGKPALADDSALEIDALDGAPGVYSARYAGENATYADNRARVLTEMKGFPDAKRTARFRTVLALAIPGRKVILTQAVTEGSIGQKEQGEEGFGYDPIFHLKGDGRSYSQMTREEKNQVSHRAKAAEEMKKILEKILEEDQVKGKK